MKWKYYIPAEWKPGKRQTWEDVWLLPDDKTYHGESIWLTIDSLTSAVEYLSEEEIKSPEVNAGEFHINGTDMLVGVKDFSREEILNWTKVWLSESGFSVTELIEGTFEEFEGTNDEARAIAQAKEKLEKDGSIEPGGAT
ncbi:MAG TPA: hypothetical protein VJS64_17830 [Pyrinomonadaceae bacterium]|nr:hypothetical protein [Pyrinomonadaceae bacterium]